MKQPHHNLTEALATGNRKIQGFYQPISKEKYDGI